MIDNKSIQSQASPPVIGVVISSMEGLYQELLWKGMVQKAQELGISLIFFPGGTLKSPFLNNANHNYLYSCLPLELLDGIIVAAGTIVNNINASEFKTFLSSFGDKKIINIGQKIAGISSITTNNRELMKSIVKHLIEIHGLKKLAFLKGPEENFEARERFLGFCEVMEEYNLKVDPELIVSAFYDPDTAKDAVKVLLDERQVTFDALLCANDDMAIGAYWELRERGLNVPEDVVLTGFDGIEDMAFKYNQEPITTARQPIFEIGQEAVLSILDSIKGELKIEHKEVPGKVLFRSSCGCLDSKEKTSPLKDLKFESLRRLEMQRFLLYLKNFVPEISIVEDFDSLKKLINTAFPSLGFKSFYLTSYQSKVEYQPGDTVGVPNFSNLFAAYNENGNLMEDNQEVVIATRDLLPPEFHNFSVPSILMVQPLFSKNEQYGLIIHPFCNNESVLYGSIREHISMAFRTIIINSARKEAERKLQGTLQRLKESEEQLINRAFLFPTLLYETDSKFNFIYLNQSTSEVFELPEDDFKTRSLLSFISQEDINRLTEYCRRVSSTGSSSFIKLNIFVNEVKKTNILAKATPVMYEGRVEGFLWSAIDIKNMIGSLMHPKEDFSNQYNLTVREVEVLNLLIVGQKTREISEKLFISESTVKSHLGAIYTKMNVKNKQELFLFLEESQVSKFGSESLLFSIVSKLI